MELTETSTDNSSTQTNTISEMAAATDRGKLFVRRTGASLKTQQHQWTEYMGTSKRNTCALPGTWRRWKSYFRPLPAAPHALGSDTKQRLHSVLSPTNWPKIRGQRRRRAQQSSATALFPCRYRVVVWRNGNDANHRDCSDTYVGKRQLWPRILGRVHGCHYPLQSCELHCHSQHNSNKTLWPDYKEFLRSPPTFFTTAHSDGRQSFSIFNVTLSEPEINNGHTNLSAIHNARMTPTVHVFSS